MERVAASEGEVQRLVARAATGDTEAFGMLYDEFLDPVYRYVFLRVRDTAEAEDLSEEIFLKVWRSLGTYRNTGKPFIAWLFRLARNHVIDHLRSRRPQVGLDEVPYHAEHSEPLAEQLDRDQILRHLQQLSDDQWQVIVLRFYEGLDTRAIAQMLGKTEGAVRQIQVRSLAALRRSMTAEGASHAG